MTVKPAAAAATGLFPRHSAEFALGQVPGVPPRVHGLSTQRILPAGQVAIRPAQPVATAPVPRTRRRWMRAGALIGLFTLALGNHATAGDCLALGPGTWDCSGPAVVGEPGAFLGGVAGAPVVVDIDPSFGLTTPDTVGLGVIALFGRDGIVINGEDLGLLSAAGTALGVTNTNPGSSIDVSLGGVVSGQPLAGSSTPGIGVDLSNSAGGAIVLDGVAAISGRQTAVTIRSGAPGLGANGAIDVDLSGPLGSVTDTTLRAIGHGGDMTITTTGAVTSDLADAILAGQLGTGALSVTTGTGAITAATTAILAFNSTAALGDLSATTGSGAVLGQDNGLVVQNTGAGATIVSTGGDVTGSLLRGIHVSNGTLGTAGISLGTAAGSTTQGRLAGLRVDGASGPVSINAAGAVVATGGIGVEVLAGTGVTGVEITTTDVTGAAGGISVRMQGSGDTRVTATGQVTGGAVGSGISVNVTSPGAGAAHVAATGGVSGQDFGILVTQSGAGATTVQTGDGDVLALDGASGAAVMVDVAATNTAAVTVTSGTGTLRGAHGVWLDALGSGRMTFETGGLVEGQAGVGARLRVGTGGATVTLATGSHVTGATHGLDLQLASGGVLMTGAGVVTGGTGDGLRVSQTGGSGDLDLTVGAVQGATQGILATNWGTGGISITARGAVTGGTGSAVNATVFGNGGLVADLRGDVTSAGSTAVALSDFGTGQMRVVTGALTTLRGAAAGMVLDNHGGALSVEALGTLEGQAGQGLWARSRTGGGAMTLTLGSASGSSHGVELLQQGQGDMRLTATGRIAGAGLDGVNATMAVGSSGLLMLDLGTVEGQRHGILATHEGQGGISISTSGAVRGVTGVGILTHNAVNAPGAPGGLTITSLDSVRGAQQGIWAVNAGTGDLVIDAQGLVTGDGSVGIHAENTLGTRALSVTMASVTGQGHAVRASNLGTGDTGLTVTAGALVQGAGGDGLSVLHVGAGHVSVALGSSVTLRGTGGNGITLDSQGAAAGSARMITLGLGSLVEGSQNGIQATLRGGRLSIIGTGTARGLAGDGVFAQVLGGSDDALISLRNAEGAVNGISFENHGAGAIQLLSDGVISGATGLGARVVQGSIGQGHVVVTLGTVTGATGGVLVEHKGDSGDIRLTTNGAVTATGAGAIGLVARNTLADPAAGGIRVTTRAVTGTAGGILVEHGGSGLVRVLARDTVAGGSGDAIRIRTASTATDLTLDAEALSTTATGVHLRHLGSGGASVTVNGAITAGLAGLDLEHAGAGSLGLTLGGDVSALAAGGIGLKATASRLVSGGLTLTTAAGTVLEGALHGAVIQARGGTVRLETQGTIVGHGGNGMSLVLGEGVHGATLSLASVSGGETGIDLTSSAQGPVTLQTSGIVLGTNRAGIQVTGASGQQGQITLRTQDVTGGLVGIQALHQGTGGGLSLTATGLVRGLLGDGVFAGLAGDASGLDVVLNSVEAAGSGVTLNNQGLGLTSLTATGGIVAQGPHAVRVETGQTAGAVQVTLNQVEGAQNGVILRAGGTGATGLAIAGPVLAGTGVGVQIETNAGTAALNVDLDGAVSGGSAGVSVLAEGTGAVTLDLSGAVSATAGSGLVVQTGAAVTGLSLTTDAVTGTDVGIAVTHWGSDLLHLQTAGPVRGTTSAIRLQSTGAAAIQANLSGDVTGLAGPAVQLLGGGGITLTQDTGTAISGASAGVLVIGTGGPLDLTLNGTVHSQTGVALQVVQSGSGAVTLVARGEVSSSTGSGVVVATQAPVSAHPVAAAPGGVSVRLASVTTEGTAVTLTHAGSGDASVSATGAIVARNGAGVALQTGGAAGGLTLDLDGAVTGASIGVSVLAEGDGAVGLELSGAVTATAGDGLVVQTGAAATGLTLTTGAVSGTGAGMMVSHGGSGDMIVTAGGALLGGSGLGAQVVSAVGSGAMTVQLGMVTGRSGVVVQTLGGGDTSLSTGVILATAGVGLGIETGADTGALELNAAGITAGDHGLVITHAGSGAADLTLTGPIQAGGVAASVATRAGSGALDLTTATLSGADGLVVLHDGTGVARVTLTGDVTAHAGVAVDLSRSTVGSLEVTATGGQVIGGTGLGLRTGTVAGGVTRIDLAATVEGDIALAALGEAGSLSRITLRDGALLTGGVALISDAGDSLTTVASGAVIDGAVLLGEGDDRIEVTGADMSLVTLLDGGGGSSGVDGWDALVLEDVNQGWAADALVGWEDLSLTGETVLGLGAGAADIGLLTVGADAALVLLGGDVALSGGLALEGQLSLQNGAGTDLLTLSGDFTGGGVVFLDVDFATDTADRLVVGGNVITAPDAPTILAVDDLTVGAATGNDLVLVDVGGTTGEGDFVLAGGPIFHGAYGYTLQLTDEGQWVLAEGFSIISSSFEATPSVLKGFALLPTLAMRQDARLRLSRDGRFAGWMRVSGDIQDTSLRTLSGADVTSREAVGLEVGIEMHSEGLNGAGHWVVGASLHTGTVRGSVTSDTGTALIDASGWGLGASVSWLGDGGSWLDLQGRVGWQKTDLTTSATGTLLTGHDSTVWALGIEAGHRIALKSGGALVPQVQLTFARVEAGDNQDSMGNAIVLGSNDSINGRVALTYEFGPTSDDRLAGSGRGMTVGTGNRRHPFHVTLGLLHDFASRDAVQVAGIDLTASSARTWGELGLGGRWSFARGHEIYAEGSYRRPLGGGAPGDRGLSFSAGLRLAW